MRQIMEKVVNVTINVKKSIDLPRDDTVFLSIDRYINVLPVVTLEKESRHCYMDGSHTRDLEQESHHRALEQVRCHRALGGRRATIVPWDRRATIVSLKR